MDDFFVGRNVELDSLREEYSRDSAFVVIYGRRRVGKTTLIKEFIKDKHALYFLATQEPESQNIQEFARKTADFTGLDYLRSAKFQNWHAVFEAFVREKQSEKKILVIDEFQYLVQANSAFPSVFQKVWDEILKDHNVMVILCGSLINMMTTQVLSYNSPLYGRRTSQMRLKPLSFSEVRKFFPEKSFAEQVELYSICGGVPKYLDFFRGKGTITDHVQLNILRPSGFLYEEPSFLLSSEVREPINYFSILKTIAAGNHKLLQISTVLEQKSNSLSPYLSVLIELGLLERRIPVTEENPQKSRKGLFFISDPFIDFWFKYVYPHRSELELGNDASVLRLLEMNFRTEKVPLVYEDICREIFMRLCREGKIAFVPGVVGSYWNTDSSVQIDVVALDTQRKRIFVGECTYTRNPVSLRVYADLQKKCESGVFSQYEIVYGLFSKSGFDARVMEIASQNPNLILVDKDQLIQYSENNGTF
jgi:hypothetical protein